MIKGYKVFSPDWTCRGMQYKVGQTYEMEGPPRCCTAGYHFCKIAADCFDYYKFDPDNKVAEVIAHGDVVVDGDKSCTNKIEIVREIPWAEILTIVNFGEGNSGLKNTGDRNTGHWNTGNQNTGNRNTGDQNTGNRNTGDQNTGDQNTGDRNTGHWNIGHWNTGHWNTGHWNTGNQNTGNRNTGHWNTGHWNQGDCCSGDFNISDHEAGCFCTEERPLRFFDKESDVTFDKWRKSKAYSLLTRIQFQPAIWVCSEDMTEVEKEANPTYETTGGYLKVNDLTTVYQDWWDTLTKAERQIIKKIPNFDPEKFKKITGIKV